MGIATPACALVRNDREFDKFQFVAQLGKINNPQDPVFAFARSIWYNDTKGYTEDDISGILAYVDNFEEWVRTCEDFPKDSYEFDQSRIGVGDYFFILNKYGEAEKAFWNYNLYYFDVDAGILYYFHNNI